MVLQQHKISKLPANSSFFSFTSKSSVIDLPFEFP